jgi:hypothetical protein
MELDMSLRKIFVAAALGFAVVAPAGAQTLQNQAGTAYFAPSIGLFATLGNNLFGMLVTGQFSDGQSFSGQWGDLGGGVTGVTFAGRFQLTLGGTSNTFSSPFTLTVYGSANRLSNLTLSGATGPVIFDRTFGGAVGTTNSATGRDFSFVGTDSWNTLITYSNAVQLVGTAAPVGDVFESVNINFRTGGGFQGSNAGRSVQFYQDVDNVITGGTILPVPEPNALLLTATGAGAMLVTMRRRKLKEARA